MKILKPSEELELKKFNDFFNRTVKDEPLEKFKNFKFFKDHQGINELNSVYDNFISSWQAYNDLKNEFFENEEWDIFSYVFDNIDNFLINYYYDLNTNNEIIKSFLEQQKINKKYYKHLVSLLDK